MMVCMTSASLQPHAKLTLQSYNLEAKQHTGFDGPFYDALDL